jgi:hypothetical protein
VATISSRLSRAPSFSRALKRYLEQHLERASEVGGEGLIAELVRLEGSCRAYRVTRSAGLPCANRSPASSSANIGGGEQHGQHFKVDRLGARWQVGALTSNTLREFEHHLHSAAPCSDPP